MATRSQNPLGLPPKAERQWTHVYQSALDRGLSKQGAAAQATCAVKRGYYKKGGRWVKRKKALGKDAQPPGCRPSKSVSSKRSKRSKNPRGKAGPSWEPSSQVGHATQTQSEAADFAIRRWHELAPWQERDLTWAEFGRRIRETGDPGSRETAKVIETIPGYVKDWALSAEPVAKIKRRVLR